MQPAACCFLILQALLCAPGNGVGDSQGGGLTDRGEGGRQGGWRGCFIATARPQHRWIQQQASCQRAAVCCEIAPVMQQIDCLLYDVRGRHGGGKRMRMKRKEMKDKGRGWRQCVTETPPSAPRTSAGCGRWLHSIITTICGHTLRTALDQRALLVESRRTEATLQTSACSNEQIIVISSYLGLP